MADTSKPPDAVSLAAYVGKTGLLTVDKWRVPVTIIDAKRAYGHLRFRVRQSIRGHKAEAWADGAKVTVEGLS